MLRILFKLICNAVITQVVIPPLHDLVVLFHSDRVLHRVLPANAPRCCFTIWLDGTSTNTDADVLLRQKHLDLSNGAGGVPEARTSHTMTEARSVRFKMAPTIVV